MSHIGFRYVRPDFPEPEVTGPHQQPKQLPIALGMGWAARGCGADCRPHADNTVAAASSDPGAGSGRRRPAPPRNPRAADRLVDDGPGTPTWARVQPTPESDLPFASYMTVYHNMASSAAAAPSWPPRTVSNSAIGERRRLWGGRRPRSNIRRRAERLAGCGSDGYRHFPVALELRAQLRPVGRLCVYAVAAAGPRRAAGNFGARRRGRCRGFARPLSRNPLCRHAVGFHAATVRPCCTGLAARRSQAADPSGEDHRASRYDSPSFPATAPIVLQAWSVSLVTRARIWPGSAGQASRYQLKDCPPRPGTPSLSATACLPSRWRRANAWSWSAIPRARQTCWKPWRAIPSFVRASRPPSAWPARSPAHHSRMTRHACCRGWRAPPPAPVAMRGMGAHSKASGDPPDSRPSPAIRRRRLACRYSPSGLSPPGRIPPPYWCGCMTGCQHGSPQRQPDVVH